ncbi:U3 small nucleolar RNA-associated protein Mpp10p [Monosporozyma unispora]|nr:U3 snoRNP protein [Kazachstania unispora]
MSSKLLTILNENPYDLVSSSKATKQSLRLVKDYLDSVIKTYKTIGPQENNKTSLDEIVVDGLDANQVWWQAKMVIDNIEGDLMERIQDLKSVVSSNDVEEEFSDSEDEEEQEHEEEEENVSEQGFEIEGVKETEQDDESDIDMDIANGKDDFDLMEEAEEQQEKDETPSDVYEDAKEDVSMKQKDAESEQEDDDYDSGKEELNDKFFDIEEFNKQTLAQEDGNLEEDNADDDEDIDYFGDIPSEDDEEAVYYNDFFDKPTIKTKQTDTKKSKKTKRNILGDDSELDESDYENAMASAKLDLFEDDEEDYDEDEENELGKNGKKLSNFEKQQLEIQKQIEQLEKEAIEEKKWALKGEVKAKDRPEDALLTENLEFDRNSKPVPVITSEITESLEDMIRDRIKNRNFDDLAKRTVLDMQKKKYKPDFELSDTKSSKSLAELYEDNYKGVDENIEISEELQKSHDEISQLFANLSYKLDALSSAHFVPRPSQKSLEVRVDTAAITMEDAQPLTMSSASTLAPQEVYSVGKSDNTNEIRLKDGTTMARDELSREDKTRLRRAAKRKRTKQLANQVRPAKKSKKDSVIETLSHAKNITIINKKGEKHDIKGNVQRNNSANNIKNVKL